MSKSITVDLSMFEGKTRECVSRAVQQRMFSWGYKWYTGGMTEQFTDAGCIYIEDSSIAFPYGAIPHPILSDEYMDYTAEEFLSLITDPLKGFEVGKPYTDNERVVICTESVDAHRFKGVSIYNGHSWKHDELWKELKYPKSMFYPIDPSRIQIEVLPCK